MSLAAAFDRVPAAEPSPATACRHCGAPVPRRGDVFCCGGCAGAYALVQELGLQRYYDQRIDGAAIARPRRDAEPLPELASHVCEAADGSKSLQVLVDGLHCPACVWLIEKALGQQPDVLDARVNLTSRRLALRWRGGAERAEELVILLQRLGYRALPFDAGSAAARDDGSAPLLRAMAVAGFATANVMLLSVAVWAGAGGEMGAATRSLLHWISALVAMPAIAYAGRPFFRSAILALRAGHTNMDVPITIGIALATAMSLFETATGGAHAYFESVSMLLFALLVGRFLDLRARGKARSAALHLLQSQAQAATLVVPDGGTQRVAPGAVPLGARVLVAAGDRIPVDGRIASGASTVDRSLVDGEAMPVPVRPGDEVLAGMINLGAPVEMIVTAVGDKTFLAEVARMIEAAEGARGRLAVLADRVARRYAPAVHLLALATFAGWVIAGPWQIALLNAVSVLIITCPCALGLAVPVAQVVASGSLMRRGILLKSGTALERIAEIDTVVFDKTGTLTLGRPELLPDPRREPAALGIAASLAVASRHPLSRALCRAVPDTVPAADIVEHPGAGLSCVTAEGEIRLGSRAFCDIPSDADDNVLELWLTRPGAAPCRFAFADELRPDAAEMIRRLGAQGLQILLFSGDRPGTVAAIAGRAGIATWRAGLTPAAKRDEIDRLGQSGAKVLMVGDGLNDGPALASAHASISPSNAADLCQVTADVVFQGDSLAAVPDVIALARQTRAIVRQNIGLALLYNLCAVPVAMAGLVTPLLAALAMSSSSLIVVANAMRLARRRS